MIIKDKMRELFKRRNILVFFTFNFSLLTGFAQDKIVNPDISYAGQARECTIKGIAVSGVDGYEDYMLTSISGLSIDQKITVPGNEITEAVKRYWHHGLFSEVKIAADSIVGDDIYLHIYLQTRPRVSTINYIGLKKTEKNDMEEKLGLLSAADRSPSPLKMPLTNPIWAFLCFAYLYSSDRICWQPLSRLCLWLCRG